jgi:hypothetical protein
VWLGRSTGELWDSGKENGVGVGPKFLGLTHLAFWACISLIVTWF